MELTLRPSREIAITPDATARVILGEDAADIYGVGVASVTNGSAVVQQGAGANWRREHRMAPPEKFKKSGATAVQEYLVSAKNETSGDLTIDRNYEEATDAAAAYTLSKTKPIKRYVIENDLSGSNNMNVQEIGLDGTLGATFVVAANTVHKSEICAVLGLRYARVAANGAARVKFSVEV
jgi:hypothetical protein